MLIGYDLLRGNMKGYAGKSIKNPPGKNFTPSFAGSFGSEDASPILVEYDFFLRSSEYLTCLL